MSFPVVMGPSWLVELRAATLRNMSEAARLGRKPAAVDAALDELGDAFASAVRYRFDGPLHRFASLPECVSRGYGACADVAAWLLAVAHAWKIAHHVSLAFETSDGLPGYSHVRLLHVSGAVVDPYARFSAAVRPHVSFAVRGDVFLKTPQQLLFVDQTVEEIYS